MINQPKAIILKAAGTNCDEETKFALELVGFNAEIVHISRIKGLDHYHLVVIPGGFTYGDDLGAGTILASELRLKLQTELIQFVETGRLVLGICNGFQVLVKSGLLPDIHSRKQTVTLTVNDSGRYEDRWVYLKITGGRSIFLPQDGLIELPVAHGEGKFVVQDESLLNNLKKNGQIILRYVNPVRLKLSNGVNLAGEEAGYPYNPNGSIDNIAGICDTTGRILGLMPHPERYHDPTNHPQWTRRKNDLGEPHGLMFFRNAYNYIKGK